jgi:hypothetical protein
VAPVLPLSGNNKVTVRFTCELSHFGYACVKNQDSNKYRPVSRITHSHKGRTIKCFRIKKTRAAVVAAKVKRVAARVVNRVAARAVNKVAVARVVNRVAARVVNKVVAARVVNRVAVAVVS